MLVPWLVNTGTRHFTETEKGTKPSQRPRFAHGFFYRLFSRRVLAHTHNTWNARLAVSKSTFTFACACEESSVRAASQAYQETREIELPAPNLRIGNVGTTGGRFAGFKKWTAMQVFSKLWVYDGWIVSLTR